MNRSSTILALVLAALSFTCLTPRSASAQDSTAANNSAAPTASAPGSSGGAGGYAPSSTSAPGNTPGNTPGSVAIPLAEPTAVELGSLDPKTNYKLKIGLERAAIRYIHLTDYLYEVLSDPSVPDNHYLALSKFQTPENGKGFYRPLAAIAVTVDSRRLEIDSTTWQLLSTAADAQGIATQAVYRLVIPGPDGQPLLEIHRTFELKPDSYELLCRQQLVNPSTTVERKVILEQLGTADAPPDQARYMGDHRAFVAGYFNLEYDPSAKLIFTDKTFLPRATILSNNEPLWPRPSLTNDPAQARLAWAAAINRYFALVLHRPFDIPADALLDARLVPPLDAQFSISLLPLGTKPREGDDLRPLVATLTSSSLTLAPQASAPLDLALFAGPRKPELFGSPAYKALSLSQLVRYELGCAFCTFQPLARLLLAFMKAIYAVSFDWGFAIIALVICVRLILHPLTRRSQIQMAKFSKQMAAMQPEMEKLKRKFQDDPKRLQSEQAKLMREKGINPANVLGCLPVFLQMPIWVALYAMLYFAIELRHQPAFWGVFQAVSSGQWYFLADLSSPDAFLRFTPHPLHINFPMLNAIDFSVLNILPILWGVAMFIQQKYMAPPAANEQARQQQKMMNYMMLIFALLFYSAPSGLTLYMLASTFAGALDSYIVRRHIQREEEAGTLFDKKAPKPGSLRDRFLRAVADRRRRLEETQRRLQGQPPRSRRPGDR
ncbi:MAG: YidC/Oxa1 family insertase periplasmic-domain containing protein [Phycisphaeraceae bacterium]|nr:YidC/Oxa1 family insertase periplasmic-domain containing protein [Phycisphaeraceae bacterium]